MRRRIAASLAAAVGLTGAASAQVQLASAGQDAVAALRAASIEELANVEVTSVSKRAESLGQAPAAIFVITPDDIRRYGATSLPETLRLAPNLQVQRVDARQYSISARGFNGYENANKLLVLIDGRSIYTPLASSVYWDLNEPYLEDLERIEVVSGPGGTLYGPNAVNGVISIVSRSAADTTGFSGRAVLGTEDRRGALRYGGRIGAGAFRVYATATERQNSKLPTGRDAADGYRGVQGGFRADFDGDASAFTIQGDIFDQSLDAGHGDGNKGHNLLARWTRATGDRSSLEVQAYYDRFERRFTMVTDSLSTYDVAVQHNWSLAGHEIVTGAGFRVTRDAFINNLNAFRLSPERRTLAVGNAFIQDRIALSDQLSLTAGIKLEKTSFTGIEILPNLRLAWSPDERTLLWSAVSRAVRTPSRIDRQLVALPILAPGDGFDSEKLIAVEAGYRGQPMPGASVSVSLFYNFYDDIRTTEPTPGSFLPIRLRNGITGRSYGAELWGSYQAAPWWRLSAGLFLLGKDFRYKTGVTDLTGGEATGQDPPFQAIVRSQFNPTSRLEIDLSLRAVDDVPGTTGGNIPVKAYLVADARVGWRVADALELEVAAFNLLSDSHGETYLRPPVLRIERRVQVGARVRF